MTLSAPSWMTSPIIACVVSVSLFGCGEIDNYEAPNSRVEGRLIDATTNEPIPSQGYNGARIQMYEGRSVTATIEGIDISKPVFVRITARTEASALYNYSTITRL